MDEHKRADDELFEVLAREKKKRRRRTVRAVVITIAVMAVALITAVVVLQRRVSRSFASAGDDVLSYAATVGSISTTVTGSGQLVDVDAEEITVPDGVAIGEVVVEANDAVGEGEVLATLDMSTVMSAMADLQKELDELDEQLDEAEDDEVSDTVRAGVSGRVKAIYAGEGSDVAGCMVENGALAVLSLDGYMAIDIETGALSAGDAVTVDPDDGWLYTGTVERVSGGTATILVSDNGPALDAEAVILAEDGETELGRGTLYVHNPLRVTGFAGTVESVGVSVDEKVSADTALLTLSDTSYSANYDAILKQRQEKEAEMLELLTLYEDGALRAPFDGRIVSVDYGEDGDPSAAGAAAAMGGMVQSGQSGDAVQIVTLSPEKQVEVTVSVDESDILALELDQEADVTISSLDEARFTGKVTQIDKSSSAAGTYSAVVTLDKDPNMLTGMTAKVTVKIEGADGTLFIPVDALHHTSTTAFVYTSYDGETQEYGGMVEVTEGMSNDDYVEITSGLREGDVVYYVEAKSSDFSFPFGGGGGGDFGGGDFGGGRPSFPFGGQN